jgi:hypothetical protein
MISKLDPGGWEGETKGEKRRDEQTLSINYNSSTTIATSAAPKIETLVTLLLTAAPWNSSG